MSIPDDVVERVARAIAAVEYGNDAPDISIGETHLALARAALSASGYVEMREALTRLERSATWVSEKGASTGPQWISLSSAIIGARVVLRARR